ncbi:hypothetical protein DVH24_038063, partial [Malus domestica]
RELVLANLVKLLYVNIEHQIADIHTKSLSKARFNDADGISSKAEPERKWYGDRYKEGSDSKEETETMEKAGDPYSGGTVAEVNKLAYQGTSKGKQECESKTIKSFREFGVIS